MRINESNRYEPFFPALADRKIDIDGIGGTLSSWLEEFNFSRGQCQGTVNGVAWRPYELDEITRDDLALEFAGHEYEAGDGTGEVEV